MSIAALEGHWIGNSSIIFKQTEDSARVGVNRLLTAGAQMASISNVVSISEKVLNSLKYSISAKYLFLTKSILYLTPIITNVLGFKYNLKENPYLKRSVILINNHIGSICQLAIAVSSVVLIAFGQPSLGYIALTWVIIGFVQRRCWIPTKLSKGIDSIGFVGTNLARIILGSYYSKFLAFVEIGYFFYLRIEAYKKSHITIKPSSPNILISDVIDNDSLQINTKHLAYKSPIPKPPEIDLKQFKVIFQKFNLKNPDYFRILKKNILEDEHWNEFHSDKNSDKELIKYIQTGLNNFVNNVSNRSIKSGDISDYRSLQARARHIAHKLPSCSKEDQFITVIRLSLASYYCPAGYIEKVRTIYYAICSVFEQDSIRSRAFQVLDEGRKHLFQSFLYSKLMKNNPMTVLLDPQDNHVYNEFLNFLGEKFNLSETEDAKEDALSYLDIIDKKILQFTYRSLTKPFIEKYNKNYIIKTASEGIINNQIPYELLNRWFIDEYLLVLQPKTPKYINETDRNYNDRLIKEAEKWVQSNVYDLMSGKVEKKYLLFFLIKMGILK